MSQAFELDEQLVKPLQEYCRRHALSENDLLNQLLRVFLERKQAAGPSSYDLWREVFTPQGSGIPDLGSRAKQHLREKLRERHID